MKLVDTHAHLYWDSFKEDFDEIIQRAVDTGISTIINVGIDVEKSQEALDQAQNTDWPSSLSVYSTIGIHPHEALRFASLTQGKPSYVDVSIKEDMEKLEEIYKSNPGKVAAVGECGLDYFFREEDSHVDPADVGSPRNDGGDVVKNLQKKLFQAHIDLAKKLNLPLIIHCRDDRSKDPENSEAWDGVLEMIGNQPAILHCYSGLSHTTNYLLHATNSIVSFAANITYPKNEYLREAVKALPLNRILLETDSPFLAPQSKRGQRNEPSSIKEIAELIAELKGISFEEVAEQTTKNVKKVFNIK